MNCWFVFNGIDCQWGKLGLESNGYPHFKELEYLCKWKENKISDRYENENGTIKQIEWMCETEKNERYHGRE